MNFQHLLFEPQAQPHIALIRLHRPAARNAINRALMQELVEAFKLCDQDPAVRVVILTGNDQAFAAGADIKELANMRPVAWLDENYFAAWDQLQLLRKPLIAAVSGYVLGGGCELMLRCDMVIASETATFGQPEIKLGLMPGAGGTQLLPRIVGRRLATELILTGKTISAEEAWRYGLVNRVVPANSYLDEAFALARSIASLAPHAVQLALEAVRQASATLPDQGLLTERKNFYLCFTTEDHQEGIRAFLEKRTPSFQGR